ASNSCGHTPTRKPAFVSTSEPEPELSSMKEKSDGQAQKNPKNPIPERPISHGETLKPTRLFLINHQPDNSKKLKTPVRDSVAARAVHNTRKINADGSAWSLLDSYRNKRLAMP